MDGLGISLDDLTKLSMSFGVGFVGNGLIIRQKTLISLLLKGVGIFVRNDQNIVETAIVRNGIEDTKFIRLKFSKNKASITRSYLRD